MNLPIAFLALSLFATPALAVPIAISNLDTMHHRIGVRSIGGEEYVKAVAPNATIYIHDHDPWLKNLDDAEASPIRAEDDQEYTIWRNGKLQLQRYNNFGIHGHH